MMIYSGVSNWAMNHPVLSTSIVGVRNSTQLELNLKARDIDMTKELRDCSNTLR
ncbi:MAG: hypothetical protein U9N30_01255 [Campylobacterota bacterium]|nr:hypothetical protein [Campylobacterota bacterium]